MKLKPDVYLCVVLCGMFLTFMTVGVTLYLWATGKPVPTALEGMTVGAVTGIIGLIVHPERAGQGGGDTSSSGPPKDNQNPQMPQNPQ